MYGLSSGNGGYVVSFTGVDRAGVNLNFTGTLTTCAVTGQSGFNAVEIYAVEVDGCVLIDNFDGKAVAAAGNVAPSNFNPFTVNINTQRGQESGYATANPLDELNATLSNGNLDVEVNSAGTNFANGRISVSSGKWYFEIPVVGGTNSAIGVADVEGISGFETTGSYVYYQNTGDLWFTSASAYGASWQTAGDVIGITIDMDTPQLIFYKNKL